jgi:RND family efflux transporter MFP subunit
MKTKFAILALMGFAIACGPKPDPLKEKKEKLASLKAEVAEKNQAIKSLQEEIALLDTSKEESKVKTVSLSSVTPGVFRHFVSVQGTLDAEENLMVTSKMPGMITALRVREGDFVQKGQILAVLDDEILRKSIDEIKVGLDQVNVLFDKQKQLWDQKIGTELQYLTLKNQKESLEKKLVTLKSQMGQANIEAPFSGVVDEVFAKAGSMASPGIPLLQLVNTNELKAVAKVPDSYVAFINEGDMVNLQFPDLNKTIEAKVTFVGRIVDPLSRTFRIEVKVPGSLTNLKPNLLTLVQINDKTSNSAIVVDENLIQPTEAGKVLFIAGEEKGQKVALQRIVTTGLSYNGKVEILSGLAAGDRLITTGYQDLSDQQVVRF